MNTHFYTLLLALIIWLGSPAYCDPQADQTDGWTMDMNAAQELLQQGHKIQAEAKYNSAVEQAQKAGNDQRVCQSLERLSALQAKLGRYQDAQQTQKKVVDLTLKDYGGNSSEYALTLEKLAALYLLQRDNYQVEVLYRQVLRIREQLLYKDEKEADPLINSLMTYGKFYMEQGKWISAEDHFKRALQLSEKLHEDQRIHDIDKDLKVCQSFSAAANRPDKDSNEVQERRGDQGQQELNFTAVGKRTSVQPAKPLDVGSMQNRATRENAMDEGTRLSNAAQVLSTQGKYEAAEALFKQALAYWLKSPPVTPRALPTCFNNMGLFYHQQGKFKDAIPMYQQALSLENNNLSPQDPLVAITLDDMAQSYRMLGKYADAEPLYKRALSLEEKTMSADDPDMAITTVNLALLYMAQSKYSEAEPLLKKGLSTLESKLGARNPDYLQCQSYYADLLRKTNRNAEARKIEEQIKQARSQ